MTDYYYHSTIRKVVVAFASLFNDIYISRKDEDGKEIERFRVPIAYGPKQKFLARLDKLGTNFDQPVKLETYLPRLSFEISNLQYDSSRKLNTIQKTIGIGSDNQPYARYERVPYNISFTLSIMSKTMDDNLQIMEQILPMFGPEFTFTIKAIDPTDMDVDIPLVFSSSTLSDGDDGSYGDYGTRKITVSNIQFVAKMYLYGPVAKQKIITETDIRLIDSKFIDSMLDPPPTYSTINAIPMVGVDAQEYNPNAGLGATNGAEISIVGGDYGETIYLAPSLFGISSFRMDERQFESPTIGVWDKISQTMANSYDVWNVRRGYRISASVVGNPSSKEWRNWFIFACQVFGLKPSGYDELYPPNGKLIDLPPADLNLIPVSSSLDCNNQTVECFECEQYWNKYFASTVNTVNTNRMLIDPQTLPPGPPGETGSWYGPEFVDPARLDDIFPTDLPNFPDEEWATPLGTIPKFPCSFPSELPEGPHHPSHDFWPVPPAELVAACCNAEMQDDPTTYPCRGRPFGVYGTPGAPCILLSQWWTNWLVRLNDLKEQYVDRANPALLNRRSKLVPAWIVDEGYVPYVPADPTIPLEDLERKYNLCRASRGPLIDCFESYPNDPDRPYRQPDVGDPELVPLTPHWWDFWNGRLRESNRRIREGNPCPYPLELPVLNYVWFARMTTIISRFCTSPEFAAGRGPSPCGFMIQCPSGLMTFSPHGFRPDGVSPLTPNGWGLDGIPQPEEFWKPWRYYPANQNGCFLWVQPTLTNCNTLPNGDCLCLNPENNVYSVVPKDFCGGAQPQLNPQ
jgi:hypothetical protein